MEYNKSQFLRIVFTWFCVITTLSINAFWFQRFCLDEDLCSVDYRHFFDTKEDIFPTMSICLGNPFLEDNLARYGVNKSSYLNFLNGNSLSKDMLNVDYKNVTIDVSDHVKEYFIRWQNGSTKMDKVDDENTAKSFMSNSFDGLWNDIFYRCFSLNIPQYQEIRVFSVLLSNEIFPNQTRPSRFELMTLAHLPKQLLLSMPTEKVF